MTVQTVIERTAAVGVKVGVASRRRYYTDPLFHLLATDRGGKYAICVPHADVVERTPTPHSRWCRSCLQVLSTLERQKVSQ